MRVGIVGLGLAGLRTAMLLEQAGIEVLLLEASSRAGGRVRTITQDEQALYEAGAEWVDADHHRVLSLLQEGGWSVGPAEGKRRVDWRGTLFYEDDLPPEAIADEERLDAAASKLCHGLQQPIWQNVQAASLDQQDLASFLRTHVQSEVGQFWLTSKYRGDEGEELDKIGLLGWLTGFQLYANRTGGEMCAYHLPCSGQEMCAWMLATLSATPVFGQVLQGIRQDAQQVRLFFTDASVAVDRVVLTLPPRRLEKLWFDPALPASYLQAIQACRMGRAIKIAWQFTHPWWRDEGWNGKLVSDSALQEVWDSSLGDTPILCAYVCGQDALYWQQQPNPVQSSLAMLATRFPNAKKTFLRGWFHDWIRDPLTCGGFSHTPPGFVLHHLPFIGRQFERVHIAGEHTAEWSGFMEGALESAERVVEEIIRGA